MSNTTPATLHTLIHSCGSVQHVMLTPEDVQYLVGLQIKNDEFAPQEVYPV